VLRNQGRPTSGQAPGREDQQVDGMIDQHQAQDELHQVPLQDQIGTGGDQGADDEGQCRLHG
jgi:hypothetical protein